MKSDLHKTAFFAQDGEVFRHIISADHVEDDIDTAEIINLGRTMRDAWWVDQTLMQIGVGGGDTALLTYGEVTFAGAYTNALVTDPGCTSRRAKLTDPWPYP